MWWLIAIVLCHATLLNKGVVLYHMCWSIGIVLVLALLPHVLFDSSVVLLPHVVVDSYICYENVC
jgi:hypothetical protein